MRNPTATERTSLESEKRPKKLTSLFMMYVTKSQPVKMSTRVADPPTKMKRKN